MSIWVKGKDGKKKVVHTYAADGVGGTGPLALLRGHHVCLLAMAEVRVQKGDPDPTSAPWGSPHPRRGDDGASLLLTPLQCGGSRMGGVI